jgi:hypothetical protein
MATLKHTKVEATLTVQVELTEAEVRALSGIFGYHVSAFLKVFYERMGRAYVEPYEAGVRSLHETIRGVMAGPIRQIDAARQVMKGGAK